MLKLSAIMVLFMVLFSGTALLAQPQDLQVVSAEFTKIDANQDGAVIPAEMQAYQAMSFKGLDKDSNHELDPAELEADSTGMHQAADTDQDGRVTHRESALKFNEYFEQMDKDQDGKVSEAEYTDYWKLIYKF